ncbi:hypothetical protein IJ541_06290 [bacterium]|nr:hypothetical protein [bacterium]
MGLALRLEQESYNSISEQKDSYLNKVFDLREYRNCKDYVKHINDKKLFTFVLLFLEGEYATKKSLIFPDKSSFDAFCATHERYISKVKNYPNKSLKSKFLRLNSDELEIFEFIKIRYNEIIEKKYDFELNFSQNTDSSVDDSHKSAVKEMKTIEKLYYVLGALYDLYADENADFLVPTVKKIMKKAFEIAYKYDEFIDNSVKDLMAINKTSYKRAIDVLSQ